MVIYPCETRRFSCWRDWWWEGGDFTITWMFTLSRTTSFEDVRDEGGCTKRWDLYPLLDPMYCTAQGLQPDHRDTSYNRLTDFVWMDRCEHMDGVVTPPLVKHATQAGARQVRI